MVDSVAMYVFSRCMSTNNGGERGGVGGGSDVDRALPRRRVVYEDDGAALAHGRTSKTLKAPRNPPEKPPKRGSAQP